MLPAAGGGAPTPRSHQPQSSTAWAAPSSGRRDRRVGGQVVGRGDRKRLDIEQPRRGQARPGAVAVAEADVDPFRGHVAGRVRDHDPDLGPRIGGAEPRQPGGQPERGQGNRRGDRDLGPLSVAPHRAGRSRDRLEPLADLGLERRAGLGQGQGAVEANEQLDAKMVFEKADLAAHRLAADEQLFARPGEAEMAGGGLEGDHAVQRWELRAQRLHEQNVTSFRQFFKFTRSPERYLWV
jgi:hypothetical protein